MKKILYIFLLFFFPIIGKAASVNYDITNFLIDATILENGDMSVREIIVLDGTFHGYVRELQYKNPKLESYTEGNINFANSAIYNASGINNVSVSTKKIEKDQIDDTIFSEKFTTLTRVTNEKLAMDGNYIYQRENDILSYKMFQSAEDEMVAFQISYTIEKAVVMHNDIAELYWTFIGNAFTDKINNLKIYVHLPEEPSEFYFWAHGDITGEINRFNQSTVLATMKSLDKNSVIDLRLLFNKDIIKNDTKLRNSEENAISKIRAIEEERAEKVNKQREIIRIARKIIISITILYYIGVICLWIFIYIKFDKEHKSDFNSKYYREFTGDYNVEVLDYLMNKNITPNAMSASIMNLIYKKNIAVEEIANETSSKKKYRFLLKNNENINDTEQVLLDFLFEKVGKNNTFTTTDLEKYAKSSKTCEKFGKYYTDWKNCVIKDAEKEKFYENNGIPIVCGIMLLLVTILIFLVVVYYHVDFIPSYLLLPISFMFLCYTILIKKRTKKGNEDYLRWKAFKNFLEDFGNFKIKELPEIVLWEKYLVYATVFGLAKKLEKTMNVKIKEYETLKEGPQILSNWNPWIDFQIYHMINHSVNHAVSSSIAATSANANSKNSSGGGFGGGFSGGAGFGGGGGGGHGF